MHILRGRKVLNDDGCDERGGLRDLRRRPVRQRRVERMLQVRRGDLRYFFWELELHELRCGNLLLVQRRDRINGLS